MSSERLSLCIVSHGAGALLRGCLESVFSNRLSFDVEVIVVENGQEDDNVATIDQEYAGVQTIRAVENRGFAAATNLALARTTGQWIALLNPDTIVPAGALDGLIRFLVEHPRAGAVGPALVWPDGQPQPFSHGRDPSIGYLLRRAFGRITRRDLHRWSGDQARRVDWVSGACLVTRSEIARAVGPLDEGFFLYFEDNDWCRRIRQKGWSVYFDPTVSVVHLSRPNRGDRVRRKLYLQSLVYFYRKHYGALAAALVSLAFRVAERSLS